MSITVKKNSGVSNLKTDKIRRTLERACENINHVNVDEIYAYVVNHLYDGITTKQIEDLLITSAETFIEFEPEYNQVAVRLFLQKLQKEVFGKSTTEQERKSLYKQSFPAYIKYAVEIGLLDKRMLDYDLNRLADFLDWKRDYDFDYMGIQTLYERYFVKDGEKRLELPQYFFMRVAMGLCLNETNKEEHVLELYSMYSFKYALPSTPTLFHSGLVHSQLASCYLNMVEDDLSHIFKVAGDNAQMAKYSGGLGTDVTNVRATGALIESTKVESQGVIPFLKIYNDVCVAINRSGKRRGAGAIYCEVWHLDFEDIIDLKKNTGDERRRTHDLHIANWVPDLFVKRVLEDGPWTFFSPNEVPELHEIYGKAFEEKYVEYEKLAKEGKLRQHKTVKAKDLWRRMLTSLFETGANWQTWKDAFNVRSPQDHVGVIHNTNLCCLTKDQLVVCQNGFATVEELFNNKQQNQVIGKTKIENASPMLLPRPNAPIVKIHTKEGYTHKVTPDHKVWVDEKGYVEAQDLEVGDKISLQQIPGMFGDFNDPELAFILGLIVGDGYINYRSANICLFDTKRKIKDQVEQKVLNVIDRYKDKILNINKTSKFPSFSAENSVCRLSSSAIYDILNYFGVNETNKFIVPNFILKGNKETVSAYLEGLYYCDGTIQASENNQSVISLVQSNKELLETIQIILLNFGIKTTIGLMNNERSVSFPNGEYQCKKCYRLMSMSIRSSKILNDITKIGYYRDSAQLIENLKKDGYKQKMYATFTGLEKLPNEDAYCLTVYNDDHLWTCNGILTKNTEIGENNSKDETAVCNLLSINLAEFVAYTEDGEPVIQFDVLREVIKTSVRSLDNVIDINFYPTIEGKNSNFRHRPVGMGQMGWQDLLFKLGIPFDDDKAILLADRLQEFISYHAIDASADLAKEKGAYSTFKGSKWDRGIFPLDTLNLLEQERGVPVEVNRDSFLGKAKWDELKAKVKENGMRNSLLMATAPTACVHEDTLITTNKGLIRIKDLNKNNETWQDINFGVAQEDSVQNATKLYCNGEQPIKEIVTKRGHIIKTTPNHRVRSLNTNGDYVWKYVSDLLIDDFIIEKNNTGDIFNNNTYQELMQIQYDHFNVKHINIPKKIDETFSEMLGYYMGDGYTKDRDLFMIFHQDDKDALAFWRNYFINELGRDGTIETRDFSNIDIFGFHSKELIKLMEINNLLKAKGNNGEGSASAFVPKQILQSPPSVMKAFIRGFFDAEGSVCLNKDCYTVSCASVSEDIIRTISIMLESFGIRNTIGENKPGTLGKRNVFTLTMSSIEDATKFYNKIGFRLNRKQVKLQKAIMNFNGCATRGNVFNHPEIIKDFVNHCRNFELSKSDRQKLTSVLSTQSLNINTIRYFEKIVDISKTKVYFYYKNDLVLSQVREIKDSVGVTYDLSVPINNTYLANNFISHNTISNIVGSYPCIEPAYKNIYTKSNRNGEFTIINKYLVEDLRKIGLWTREMLEEIKLNNGSIQKITGIPRKLKQLYKETFEIDAIDCLKQTAVRGKWIDQSQSHNVFVPKEIKGKQLSNIYITAWKMGLKSTYYLRTLGASMIEKATTKRVGLSDGQVEAKIEDEPKQFCSIDNPDCESCQ